VPRHRSAPPATSFRRVFGLGEFRALWAAQLLSVAGDQLARVALTILVYQRTSSALLAAAAYAASIAPQFAGGLLLSGLADRWPRRAVMIACDLARAPLAALMAVPRMPVAALIGLLCAVTALGAPFGAARAALYPEVLGDAYPLGAAVTMTTLQAAQVLGFTAGGALVGLAGVQAAMLTDAGTFCGSALIVAAGVRRRPAATGPGPARPARGALTATLRLVLASPAARGAMLLGWVSAAYNVPEGLAAPLSRAYGGGPMATSLILAVPAAGAAAGAVALARLASPAARQRLTVPLAFLACAILTTAAARPALPVLLAILALSGLCDSYQVQAQASFVAAVPAANLGQAFGLAAGGMQLGQGAAMLVAGAAAQQAAPWLVIAVAGAAGAVAVGGIAAASRDR
jgi:hypothetical protein